MAIEEQREAVKKIIRLLQESTDVEVEERVYRELYKYFTDDAFLEEYQPYSDGSFQYMRFHRFLCMLPPNAKIMLVDGQYNKHTRDAFELFEYYGSAYETDASNWTIIAKKFHEGNLKKFEMLGGTSFLLDDSSLSHKLLLPDECYDLVAILDSCTEKRKMLVELAEKCLKIGGRLFLKKSSHWSRNESYEIENFLKDNFTQEDTGFFQCCASGKERIFTKKGSDNG